MIKGLRKIIAVCLIFVLQFVPNNIESIYAESQSEALIEMARSQLGIKERSNGSDDIIYNDWYYGTRVNNNGVSGRYAWCAVFVSWCAEKAGIPQSVIPKECNTTRLKDNLIAKGGKEHLRTSGYKPVKGDIIFFGSNASTHVGIVDYTSGNTVYYIDGNNTQTTPHGVHYSSRTLDRTDVWGFVTPNYGGSTPILPGTLDSGAQFPITQTASKRIATYDCYGNVESNHYIDPGDSCYISEVYTNGFVKVEYPVTGGKRTAYAKREDFSIPLLSVNNPQGMIDSLTGEVGSIGISGWAFDKDDISSTIYVHVYIGGPAGSGVPCHSIIANKSRPDVNNVYGVGDNHGYSDVIITDYTGTQTVYVYAINIGGGENVFLGSKQINIEKDTEKPKITKTYISEVKRESYRVCAEISDNTGLKNVSIATWTQADQSDIKWRVANNNGAGTYYIDINRSEHSQIVNWNYYNHIYAYDYAGNYGFASCDMDYRITSDTGKNIPNGKYRIVSSMDQNKYLNSEDSGSELNNINIYSYKESDNQIFDISYLEDGFYKIIKHNSDLAVDVWGDTYQLETNVVVASYHQGENQKWMFKKCDDGSYCIVSKSTGMALDVYKGYTDDGTNIEMYQQQESENQKWILKRVLENENIDFGVSNVTESNYIKKAEDIKVNVDGKELIKDVDYSLNYKVVNGYVTYTITGKNNYCGNIKKTFELSKEENHEWQTGIITFSADGKTAKAKRVCKNDSTHIEEVVATVTSSVDKKATCEEKGTTKYIAKAIFSDGIIVSGTKKVDDIAALGHNYSNEFTVDMDSTCTAKGSKSKHCSRCGAKKDVTEIDKKAHTFGDWIIEKQPTNTEKGQKKRICTVCNFEDLCNISKLSHEHKKGEAIIINPTCNQKGSIIYKCITCDEIIYEVEVDALGHDYSGEFTVDSEPTCTDKGSKSKHCSICGSKKEITEMPLISHLYGEWETVVEPIDTENGQKKRKCIVCGYEEIEVIDKSTHQHEYEDVIAKKATGKENGSVIHMCSQCGKILESKEINKISVIKLSTTSYTFDGKNKRPSVTVKDSKGRLLVKSVDYDLEYSKSTKDVGAYNVKIKFKGKYFGTVSKEYNIIPKSTSISKIRSKSKGFVVTYKKQTNQTSGYLIQYSKSASFKGAKTATVNNNALLSSNISKLAANRTYYVRVCTYKTIKANGKYLRLCSKWSGTKKVVAKR